MAFLTLNSWTVPIKRGGSYSIDRVVDKTPMFDGSPATMLSATTRRWQFETGILTARDAEGLMGMLNGRGEHFRFTEDAYSTTGTHSETSSYVYAVTPAVDLQTVAKDVYNEATGELESKYGDGSLWPSSATTNLLPADSRDAENAPTGFSVTGGSTLSAGTVYIIQGTKSLKCVTAAAANSGFKTNNATGLTGGNTYTGSCYVYATEVLNLRMTLDDGVGTTTYDFNTIAAAWVHVEATRTIDGGSTTLAIQIHNKDNNVKNFWTDMLQIEENSFATPWVDGTRAAINLDYGSIAALSGSLTFCAWARMATTIGNASNNNVILRADTTSAEYKDVIIFRRSASANNLYLQFSRDDDSGSSNSATYSTTPWDDEWHHVAFVLYADNDAVPYAALYYDGTRVAEIAAPSYFPQLYGSPSHCYIGHNNGSSVFDGRLNEVLVLPYALSDDQIAAIAGRSTQLPALPRLEAEGDFNMASDYQPEIVEGLVTRENFVGSVDSGTYYGYNRRIMFDLLSVLEV